ncbi:MAG: sugar kinase [Anaerolineae bacterium]|nr:sugar kinase [Anaerolineae bacterium]
MPEIVTVGEALVEVMRTRRDCPLDKPAEFAGPYPSGAPAIFASAAARLGASVGFVGTVGEDAFGDCVLNRLLDDGVDCSAVRRMKDRLTGIAFVAYRSDGSRSFIFHLPQAAAAFVDLEQIPRGYLDSVRYVHIMGSSLSISPSLRETCYYVAEQVKARGGTVSLDPNLRPELLPLEEIQRVCAPILSLADVIFPSGEELAMLTGEQDPDKGAARLLAGGAKIVALKMGEYGSRIYTRRRKRDIPPFRVQEVDPTGAGDCYDAAFIVGLASGWPLEVVGAFANAVGALATTRLGPMEGAFPRARVEEFMTEQGRPLTRMLAGEE